MGSFIDDIKEIEEERNFLFCEKKSVKLTIKKRSTVSILDSFYKEKLILKDIHLNEFQNELKDENVEKVPMEKEFIQRKINLIEQERQLNTRGEKILILEKELLKKESALIEREKELSCKEVRINAREERVLKKERDLLEQERMLLEKN